MIDRTPPTPHDASPRLLLVEDDPDQQLLISETLEDAFGEGCVDVCGTCAELADVARPGDYGLALVDVNLPDGNGLDLLADLRGRAPALPVMMLTGENDMQLARLAIRRGAVDYVVKAGAYLDTMPLTVEKNLAAGDVDHEREKLARLERERLEGEIANEKTARETAELEASVDPMTGCYNRRAFERLGSQLLAEAYRTGGELAMVMVDLDRFKQVNDTLGHAAGDEVIKLAARSLQANLRQMDVACRYGGDEFILLLPRTAADNAAAVAQRVADDYGRSTAATLPDGQPRTMSIGVAEFQTCHPRPTDLGGLMKACDAALYRAKETGRARICAAA